MKILMVDLGSRITGFDLIEANKLKFNYLSNGCIHIKSTLPECITTIFVEI